MHRPALIVVFAACLASVSSLICAGCSSESNPAPPQTTSAAATVTSAQTYTPQGPFPRGQAPASSLDPATVGPVISILAPVRGSVTDQASVDVYVQCDDVNGVGGVTVDGTNAQPSGTAGNVWTAPVTLQPGFNLVRVEALDSLGNLSASVFSVVHGAREPDSNPSPDAVEAYINQSGLDRITQIAEVEAAKLDLFSLISTKANVVDTRALKVTVTGLVHDPLQLDIVPASDGLTVTISASNVTVPANVRALGISPGTVNIMADSLVVVANATDATPVAQGRALGIEIASAQVTLTNFRLVTSSGLLNAALRLARNTIRNKIEEILEDLLLDTVDNLLGTALTAFGTPVDLKFALSNTLKPTGASIDMKLTRARAEGAALALRADATLAPIPDRAFATTERFVGGLPPGGSTVQSPHMFTATLSERALNDVFFAYWNSGTIAYAFDGTQPTTSTLHLSANILYPFFPDVRLLAPDPATPLVIEVSSQAAPVLVLHDQGARLQAGEVEIKILLDYMDGGPREELVTLRAALDMDATVDVRADSFLIQVALNDLTTDVIAEPVIDIEDQKLEDLLQQLAPWLLQRYSLTIPPIKIPGLPLGMALSNSALEHGEDRLTVRGDL